MILPENLPIGCAQQSAPLCHIAGSLPEAIAKRGKHTIRQNNLTYLKTFYSACHTIGSQLSVLILMAHTSKGAMYWCLALYMVWWLSFVHVLWVGIASLVLWAIRDAPPALEPMPECATWIGSQAYRCLGVKTFYPHYF